MNQKMNNYLHFLTSEIEKCNAIISASSEGKLIFSHSGKYSKWFIREVEHKTYLPKSEKKVALSLAEKRYAEDKLSLLLHEKYAVCLYLNHHCNIEAIDNDLLAGKLPHSELLRESDNIDCVLNDGWAAGDFVSNAAHPENLKHRCKCGHKVRSKSEVMIDNALFERSIPYRYECRLMLGESEFYPDFTILKPSTGKFLYWEHFGLMDDYKYQANYRSKMNTYLQYGIVPGINLFMTFESSTHPLQTADIEAIIEKILDY